MAIKLIKFMGRDLIFTDGVVPGDSDFFYALKKALRSMGDDDIYIDVGAFYGDTSVIIDKGTCYAFESSERNFKILEDNVWLNPQAKIIPVNKALSNKKFRYKHTNSNRPSFDYIEEGDEDESTTIDEYFKDKKNIKVIKIDAEGHDFRVWEGAKDTIINHKPIVIIERNHFIKGEEKIIEKWFVDQNYSISKFCQIDTVFTPR